MGKNKSQKVPNLNAPKARKGMGKTQQDTPAPVEATPAEPVVVVEPAAPVAEQEVPQPEEPVAVRPNDATPTDENSAEPGEAEQMQELAKELEANQEGLSEPTPAPQQDAAAGGSEPPADPTPTPQEPAPAPEQPTTEPPKEAKPRKPKVHLGGFAVRGGLTQQGYRVLKILCNSAVPLTRKQLRSRTGQQKGWSALFGAHTKEDGSRGLLHGGYVTTHYTADGLGYMVTAKGREAVAAHEASLAAAKEVESTPTEPTPTQNVAASTATS